MQLSQCMKPTPLLVVALALMSMAQAQRGTSGATLDLPLRITGTAISAGGFRNPTGVARIEIHLNRLSAPGQRDELLQKLKDGRSELLSGLRKAPSVGTIRFNTQLAWDLRYASAQPVPENTVQLFLATDRPMSFAELWNQPEYSDYPFTLINLELGPPGTKGKGTMILAAQIRADRSGRFVHVENFGSMPVQLNNLEVEGGR